MTLDFRVTVIDDRADYASIERFPNAHRIVGDIESELRAARSKGVEVKVFGGEVESLSSENIEGVGVRVVVEGRQGFAWAGSLEPDVVAETLAEARDNAGFGTPDEYLGVPDPDEAADPGGDRAALDLWREALVATPADDKVALALELERAVMAADPRIRGVRTVSYGDGASQMALANSRGVEATARRTVCSISALTLASPLYRGDLWRIRGTVGKSVRTYHRSAVAPANVESAVAQSTIAAQTLAMRKLP